MKALRSRGLSLIAQKSFVERFDRFVAHGLGTERTHDFGSSLDIAHATSVEHSRRRDSVGRIFVAAVGIHWKPTRDDPLTLLKEFKVRSADFGRHQAQTVGLCTHFEPLRQSVAVGRGKGRTTVGHGQDIGANGTTVTGVSVIFDRPMLSTLGQTAFTSPPISRAKALSRR